MAKETRLKQREDEPWTKKCWRENEAKLQMERNWPEIYHCHLKIGTWCLCYLYDNIWFLLWPLPTGLLWLWELSEPSVTKSCCCVDPPSHNFLSILWVGCLYPSGRTVASSALNTTHRWLLACDAEHPELLKSEGSVPRGQTAKCKVFRLMLHISKNQN